MKQMTEQNMIAAFGGESMAHMRYLHFANQSEKEGYANMQFQSRRFPNFALDICLQNR